MAARKMHADEIDTDVELVRRLLAAQFPQWAELPIAPVPSSGTVNALYRLGDDMVVRLPRIPSPDGVVDKDLEWLPILARHLPAPVPLALARGTPAEGYPSTWGVYRWLDGENPAPGAGGAGLARDLAQFVRALHRVDATGAPEAYRGHALAPRDEPTRAAIAASDGMIDVDAVTAAWDAALELPPWPGPPTWIHGDLLPGNLLVRGDRLAAVIDWGGVGVGDPACDLLPAWAVLARDAGDVFRAEVGADDLLWERGRGWALSIALIALPYYVETNPPFAELARHMIREVLAETR